jgi:hypothetical protein
VTVAIGVVHDELVHAKWVSCLLLARPLVETVIQVEGGPGNFDVARNKVVSAFLETTFDHLLMLDTDMVFLPEHIEALVAQNHPVVSGAYFTAENKLCAFRRDEAGFMRSVKDWSDHEVISVDALGCGFCLIHRDVFTAIGSPEVHRSGPWFRQTEREEADFAFCTRAKATGLDVEVDTDVFVGHIKPRVVGWE